MILCLILNHKPEKITVASLWNKFSEETGKLAGIEHVLYMKWLENQLVDSEFKHPIETKKEDRRYYTGDEIQDEYNKLSDKEQLEVLYDAIDYMQQHNGRSRFKCIAMAMGYENYEGEDDTYFKRGKMPED